MTQRDSRGKPLIIDRLANVRLRLDESAGDGKKIVIRGEFARAGVPTENNRLYPESLWVRELAALAEAISERKVFGEVDHPADGRTKLSRSSHIITSLKLEGDVVVGEAEVMLGTRDGDQLAAILKSGGAVGVSSRGYGTTAPGPNGEEIVQEDYRLMTFDCVAEPANVTSYPEVHTEASQQDPGNQPRVQESTDMDLNKLTARELKEKAPALFEAVAASGKADVDRMVAEAKANMANDLKESVADIKRQARDEAVAEMRTDPTLAKARAQLEQVQKVLGVNGLGEDAQKLVSMKEEEIKRLQAEAADLRLRNGQMEEKIDALIGAAKEAAYRFHLERSIQGESKADAIRKIVGDVRMYENTKAIDAKVEAVKKEIKARIQEATAKNQEIAKLKQENEKLRSNLRESVQVTHDVAMSYYIDQKVKAHPKASRIKALIEAKKPTSKKQIDMLYEAVIKNVGQSRTPEEAERIRASLARGRQEIPDNLDEERQPAAPARRAPPPAARPPAARPPAARVNGGARPAAARPGRDTLAEEFAEIGGDLTYLAALGGVPGAEDRIRPDQR